MTNLNNITIGFDAKRAAQNRTGLGNYSRFIISGLSQYSNIPRLLLYTPSPNKTHCLDNLTTLPNIQIRYPKGIWNGPLKNIWRTHAITTDLKNDNVNLYHGLSNELPLNIRTLKNTRSIVTIHDLIFRQLPNCYHTIDRLIYNYKFQHACQNADRIIAVSQCTKRDIINHYNINPDKITVIYQGCDDQFWATPSPDDKAQLRNALGPWLPQHYILYVGTIEQRKNLLLLAKALLHLPKDITIIAAGKRTKYADQIDKFLRDNNLSGRLKIISGLKFSLLPALYTLADTFVYPSRYEGFGIPILEALVSRTPVIACTGSCLEEAGGPSSIYVNPDDDQALAQAITQTLSDNQLRQKMITDGLAHAQQFRHDTLTHNLLALYNDVLNNPNT